MLSFIIWFPLAVALLFLLVPISGARAVRSMTFLTMLMVLLASLHVFQHSPPVHAGYAFVVRQPWVPDLGISYHIGVNHLSAMLILLTALVGVGAVGVSRVTENARYFYALGLIMVGGLAGAFASLDLFFLYVFHEFALIPTFIMIGLWGTEHRRQAAMKITLYLGFGSMILLLGVIGLYIAAGANTFDLITLKEHLLKNPIALKEQVLLFGVLLMGFGILASLFPFHTWAPSGYGEAPPLAAMLHAGVIKKFGLYGLIAVAAPLLPEGFQYWKWIIVCLSMGNIVYCGYVAMQQRDLRYMLAYASISHVGYAFLAFASGTPIAIQGFTLFLFAHGLSTAVGFGIAGYCRQQTGTAVFSELGGLATRMPFAATAFTMAALAGCGLPGFANFPAELMIFLGSFRQFGLPTVLAVWMVVISAVYMLRAVRAVFLGPASTRWAGIRDMDLVPRMALVLLLAVLIVAGFWPRTITESGYTGSLTMKIAK